MPISTETTVKVADEVWIVTALLHREHPSRADFTVEEIVNRAKSEGINGTYRAGVYVHAQMHCVANLPPKPNRYRMLLETAPGRRRLFRFSDPYDKKREDSKIIPSAEDIPEKYHPLLMWYMNWNDSHTGKTRHFDALLALVGSGRDLWADEHADEYVRRLREDWE